MAGILAPQPPMGILGRLGGSFGNGGAGPGILQGLQNNPNAILGLAGGLLDRGQSRSNTIGDALRLSMQGSQVDTQTKQAKQAALVQQQQMTATVKWLVQNRGMTPEQAVSVVQAGPEVLKTYLQPPKEPDTPASVQEYQFAKQNGFAGSFAEWKNQGGSGDEYGVSPVWGQDENGNTVIMQLGKGGGAKQVQLPPGVRATPGTERIDLGTAWGITNRAGDIVSTIPKDLAGAARDTAAGKVAGEAIGAAPAQASNADIALKGIQDVRRSAAIDAGTGFSSYGNMVPGTKGRGFQAQVDQLKGGAFLTAIQQLQGMGALSNAEGSTATAAIARLDTAQSKEDFLKALDDYEAIVSRGKARAEARMQGGQALPEARATADPLGIR